MTATTISDDLEALSDAAEMLTCFDDQVKSRGLQIAELERMIRGLCGAHVKLSWVRDHAETIRQAVREHKQ